MELNFEASWNIVDIFVTLDTFQFDTVNHVCDIYCITTRRLGSRGRLDIPRLSLEKNKKNKAFSSILYSAAPDHQNITIHEIHLCSTCTRNDFRKGFPSHPQDRQARLQVDESDSRLVFGQRGAEAHGKKKELNERVADLSLKVPRLRSLSVSIL